MTYALVIDDTIQSLGRLPNSARRLDTGQWVMGLATAPVDMQQACGWFEVVDTPRPADTATSTFDRSVELVAGVPTVVWIERTKTQAELDAAMAATNGATLRQQVRDHVADLRTIRDSSGSMSGAQLSNAVRTLARGQIRVIRLLIGDLGGTD